jgi:thioredoxin-related protein
MRFITLSIAAILFFSAPNWEKDFSKAVGMAREQNKYIVLNFSGSDWCIPCIRMHKDIFDSPEFTAYAADNLILVNADYPRLKKNQLSKEQSKLNDQLAESYNPEGTFPLTLLLDKNGKVVKKWEGNPEMKPAVFVNAIKTIIDARN